MIYAQIKGGLVENIIKLNDVNLVDVFLEGYDFIIRIDELANTPQIGWSYDGNNFSPPSADWYRIISDAILSKRKASDLILIDLYATNTLLGLTIAQSDELFDAYGDVILRIREGAFPTALYRLQNKTPSGFVTQEMLDAWILKLQSYV